MQVGEYQPRAILGAGTLGVLVDRAARGEFDNAARAVRQRARQLYDSWERSRVPPHRPTNRGNTTRSMPSGLGRRRYAGFRAGDPTTNRLISRKRGRARRGRRRLRWGTRVRRSALGLFEGKRMGITSSEANVASNTIKRHEPFTTFIQDVAPGVGTTLGGLTIQKGKRVGQKVFVRGIRTQIHIKNNSTNAPADIRIICGWRQKSSRDQTPIIGGWADIFKQRLTTQEPIDLAETTEVINMPSLSCTAPLCSGRYFKCFKDMVVRLGANVNDTDEGSSFKVINMWWELRNKINHQEIDDSAAAAGDAEKLLNWYPMIIVYNTDPSRNAAQVGDVDYTFYSVTYFKDPIG